MRNLPSTIIILSALLAFTAATVLARVGDDTCLECHDGFRELLARTAHQPANQVHCEDCHGDGDNHAEDPSTENIRTLKEEAGLEIFEICRHCHTDRAESSSSHNEEQRSCLSCHDLWHSEKTVERAKIPTPHLVKDKTDAVCTVCHTQERAEFMKPYRHKLILSGNTCISCHDPHVTEKELHLKGRAIIQKCIDCHPETGGPFVYVHLGTQHEGCMECHVPHGSPNPNLLTRHEPRMLCLSCHTDTPLFHNQANPKYRDCTACHPAIHGSNMSKNFMR